MLSPDSGWNSVVRSYELHNIYSTLPLSRARRLSQVLAANKKCSSTAQGAKTCWDTQSLDPDTAKP